MFQLQEKIGFHFLRGQPIKKKKNLFYFKDTVVGIKLNNNNNNNNNNNVADSCEYGDELSGSKNAGNFLTSCRTS